MCLFYGDSKSHCVFVQMYNQSSLLAQSDDTNDLKKRLGNCVAVDRAV